MVILLHIILIDFGLIFFIKVTTFFSKEDKKKSKHLKNILNYCISFYFKGPTISLKIYNIVTTKKMFIWQIKLLFTWYLLVFLIQISNKNIQIHVTVASTIDLTQKKKKKFCPIVNCYHLWRSLILFQELNYYYYRSILVTWFDIYVNKQSFEGQSEASQFLGNFAPAL